MTISKMVSHCTLRICLVYTLHHDEKLMYPNLISFLQFSTNCANNDGSMQKFIGTRNIYRNRFKFKRCVVSSKVRIFSITLGYILA